MSDFRTYLGDGAYADFDGYAIVLTTENGIATTNSIVLEPEVYEALVRWVASVKIRLAAEPIK